LPLLLSANHPRFSPPLKISGHSPGGDVSCAAMYVGSGRRGAFDGAAATKAPLCVMVLVIVGFCHDSLHAGAGRGGARGLGCPPCLQFAFGPPPTRQRSFFPRFPRHAPRRQVAQQGRDGRVGRHRGWLREKQKRRGGARRFIYFRVCLQTSRFFLQPMARPATSRRKPLRVAFVHPDLGLGGECACVCEKAWSF